MPRGELVLYGTELSGHAHRVALLLRALDLLDAGIAAPRRRVRAQ